MTRIELEINLNFKTSMRPWEGCPEGREGVTVHGPWEGSWGWGIQEFIWAEGEEVEKRK